MGKRRRLNKLISKWLKRSGVDLTDDRPSVLLLSATKLRNSPKTLRRPFSLPLPFGVVSSCSKAQVRRNSSSVSKLIPRSGSRQSVVKEEVKVDQPPSTENGCISNNGVSCDVQSNRCQLSSLRLETQNVPLPPDSDSIKKSLSDRKSTFLNSDLPQIIITDPENLEQIYNSTKQFKRIGGKASKWTFDIGAVDMETSVDSIGTCSLDMEASRELPSDWSEADSTKTLRGSSSTAQAEPRQHHHLPSYLSLACTVNGYCTTTNYDSERLARSRDASPHRFDHNHLTVDQTYSVTNNLLSPPNLVPLPSPKTVTTMSEDALRACQPKLYYSYTKTVTILSNESHHHYTGSIHSDTKDSTDGCHQNREFFSYNRTLNGSVDSTTISKEYTNGKETKSFIQQRVERLYGPGALAQGFFVSKRQKNRLSESEDTKPTKDKLNQTMPDKLSDEENIEPASMRQSSSTPSLPVLRHLRPEFRAQLPLASPKKVADAQMQKSVTVPKLKDQIKMNGQAKSEEETVASELPVIKQNGNVAQPIEIEKDEKDGHYFLKILDQQATRLLTLADKVDSDIDTPDLSEEVIGKLRSASGKARLLVSQKMQQFKGLCTNNINQSAGEAFPTTNQDLQGFWDMVMLQVDQVDRLFDEINRLKANNWKEDTPKKIEVKSNGNTRPRKLVTGSKPKPSAAAEEARKQREEQRKKMIEERRKAMKAGAQNGQASIKIFVPESS